MTTATAAPARGQVTDSLVSLYGEIFHRKDGFLAAYNIEREEEIDLLGLSLAAGIDPLFLGEPGTGKTWMIELFLRVLKGANAEDFFNTLIFKETPADDIFGMRSLPAMKEGRIERMMDGYLPTAVVAYLDEVFKGSPTTLNGLLDIMANRKLKVGRTVHDVSRLLSIVGSSNELPDREDLLPFRDRWAITKFVRPVRTPEGRNKVMQIQDAYQANASQIDMTDAPQITMEQMHSIREEVRHVEVPAAIFDKMTGVLDQFEQAGHLPSQRRVGHMILAMKAHAWMRGEGEVSTNDIIVCQHMSFNDPEDADSAKNIVLAVASVFARKAARIQEALEPLTTELDRIKREISEGRDIEDTDPDSGKSLLDDGFQVMRGLRKLRKEAKQEIETGNSQGEDVTDLEAVQSDINRAYDWADKTLGGTEDD